MSDDGGNSGITEIEFNKLYSEVSKLKRQQRELAGDVSAILKRGVDIGLDKGALNVAGKAAKKAPLEAIEFFNAIIRYSQFLRVKGSDQLTLLDAFDASQPPSDNDYFDQGYSARVRGDDKTACPHDATSGAGIHWLEGYSQAATELNSQAIEDGIKPVKAKRAKKAKPEEHPARTSPDDADEDIPEFIRRAASGG